MNKKDIEGLYFERFRERCLDLTGATVVPCEAPDFICCASDRNIGVEITRLFHGIDSGKFAPIAVHAFREKIIERSCRLYDAAGGEKVAIGVLFEDVSLKDHEAVARKLADLIGRFAHGMADDILITAEDDPSLSPEFLQIRIVHGSGHWTVSEVQVAPRLTPDLMQVTIHAKSSLEPTYRSKVDETWLLIVLDRYPLAGSLSVTDESLRATYTTPFDRVYLFLSMERELHRLEVSRCPG